MFFLVMEEYTKYEQNQNFNFVTRLLHSYRYSWILSIFRKLYKEVNFKTITVVDVGCGPCKLFKVLSENGLPINYIGIEPRNDFVEASIKRYNSMHNFTILSIFVYLLFNDT